MLTENEWLIVAHNIISDYIDRVADYCDEHPDEEHVSAALAGAARLAKACSDIRTLVEQMQQQGRGQAVVKVEGYAIIPQDVAELMLKRLEDVSFSTEEDLADAEVIRKACAEPEGEGDAVSSD